MSAYIIQKLMFLPAILIAISIHEFGHAYSAVLLGDDTPKIQGRLSLNPIKHLDPIGFLFLMVVGFGWAKPVMINPNNFKNPRRDDIIVSVAGVTLNFLTACFFVLVTKIFILFLPDFMMTYKGNILLTMFYYTVLINIVLMVFNLIPIPPLDGHHIVEDIIGYKAHNFYAKYSQEIRFVLILLLATRIISKIISPVVTVIASFLFSFI